MNLFFKALTLVAGLGFVGALHSGRQQEVLGGFVTFGRDRCLGIGWETWIMILGGVILLGSLLAEQARGCLVGAGLAAAGFLLNGGAVDLPAGTGNVVGSLIFLAIVLVGVLWTFSAHSKLKQATKSLADLS